MPLYDMLCESCGHRFDDKRGYDDPKPPCTKCGAPTKNVLHPPSICFKGGGFYETDYKGK